MALEGIQGNTLGAYHYRPRAVLISTSGIFPVYLLKPWVNLYVVRGTVYSIVVRGTVYSSQSYGIDYIL